MSGFVTPPRTEWVEPNAPVVDGERALDIELHREKRNDRPEDRAMFDVPRYMRPYRAQLYRRAAGLAGLALAAVLALVATRL
jgi:hypothetical protein